MRTNIIFLEGLPGSGKTVFSRRLENDFKMLMPIKKYEEGELNPLDFGYLAIMDKTEYKHLLTQFNDIRDDIEAVSTNLGSFIMTAFTKVKRPSLDDAFYQTFSRYQLTEVNDFEYFKKTTFNLWKAFVESYDQDTLYLYGGAFLQNQYEALWLKYGLNLKEMQDYFKELINIIKPLNPLIIYIYQPNVSAAIKRTAKKRQAIYTGAFKDWFELVKASLMNMPLAKQKGYLEDEGAYRFYRDEQTFECEILKQKYYNHIKVELNNDYDAVYNQIYESVNHVLKGLKDG